MQRKKRVKSWWEFREKLSSLGLEQYFQKLFSRDRAKASTKSHCGREPSSPTLPRELHDAQRDSIRDRTQLASRFTLDQTSDRVSGSTRTLSVDGTQSALPKVRDLLLDSLPDGLYSDGSACSGIEILVRFPGEGPDNTYQIAASIDTQCKGANLMRREIWDRLNADGRRNMEDSDDFHIRNLGTQKIPVLGIARGLEWQFKNGQRTYTSDFLIIDMNQFDALIGTDTIWQYRLVEPGADLQHHLEMSARKAKRMERNLR
ncbi:retropepsin-like aspartic protease [Aspergillus undulatus]|uniref:retropepsin-like aspartic protease n=1 Tax=Aspergillus undulatus TaxID=1810928 RepID=UPI003CCCADC8